MSDSSHREDLKRVLVVDDDPDIRRMLAYALEQRALSVDLAADGDEALTHLRQRGYGVILLDLVLPRVDGFEVLAELKTMDFAVPPVIIVITASEGKVTERLDPQQIHGVIRKPFDLDELSAVVEACAEIRGRSALETMALAMIASGPILAWFTKV